MFLPKLICIELLTLLSVGRIFAQTKVDTGSLEQASQLIDIHFTGAEKDSMLDGVKDNIQTYSKMHAMDLSNDKPFPFRFDPAPLGFHIPTQQNPVNWNIPSHIELPHDKNDLAFYSILQLASLIKNKKISSLELTNFFLARLKKWGDTLHCVISLTEEIAHQQARQADEDLKKGIYRGPLQGIPYGIKDLFAVKGTLTTWGAAPFKNQRIDEDAFVYQQLRKSGAVLCAKLSLGALAMDDVMVWRTHPQSMESANRLQRFIRWFHSGHSCRTDTLRNRNRDLGFDCSAISCMRCYGPEAQLWLHKPQRSHGAELESR